VAIRDRLRVILPSFSNKCVRDDSIAWQRRSIQSIAVSIRRLRSGSIGGKRWCWDISVRSGLHRMEQIETWAAISMY
jgi:hypothetical protein